MPKIIKCLVLTIVAMLSITGCSNYVDIKPGVKTTVRDIERIGFTSGTDCYYVLDYSSSASTSIARYDDAYNVRLNLPCNQFKINDTITLQAVQAPVRAP